MLNIGQVVYDYTNNRVIIFTGFRISKNPCTSEFGFILKDGTFILSKGNKNLFKYTNLNINDKPVVGSFVDKCQCEDYY